MIGLDIGSQSIKVVELAEAQGSYVLKAAGVVGYRLGHSTDLVDVGKITDEKALLGISQVARKLFSESKISGREVAISLPEEKVFTRLVKLPLLTDQEIISAMKWEAEQYIPIPLNEAVVQHQIVERRENTSPPEVLVLLIAAPRILIDKYVKIANLAGLTPVAAETALLAASRSLSVPGKVTLLVDVGASTTNIGICKGETLVFSRSVKTAGEVFTRAVSQGFGIPESQAEEYKRAYGMSSKLLEGKVKSTLLPVMNSLAEEIKKAVHFYSGEIRGENPLSIILTGGSSGLIELSSYMTQSLNMEVVIGNPFRNVKMSSSVQKSLLGYSPLYSTAVGLAMRK